MADALDGRLLVASPALGDERFARTVVLLLHHDDDGAFGVVLNRPLPVPVESVLPTWQEAVAAPGTLFQGGPVGLDGALGLVTIPDGAELHAGVSRLAGPFGVVDLDADPGEGPLGVTGIRIFAGHSGWGAGQLEGEIAAGDWYVLDADPADAVTPQPDALWRRVLRRQGGALAIVSTFPEDPSLN
ncbi:YqgE/AlgH family protein [Actinotalea sp. Marseille-Q4924]|uniref:YqgE/AlgH family protein n=1 Tax=Actinotalea sp. Marseille-Q4924 TaxID=2866571 RepID=UPI001CE3CA89|nr:YqgE/AlgH family protein [Actinotalea sp. Marseille-Q4924]